MVVNCAWRLAPWADVLYACDGKWWRSAEVGYGQSALRKFHGLKITNDEPFSQEFDVRHIKIQHESRFIMEPGVIGNGLNGGFQALNLALHFGARRIMLLGYDMHADNGLHFHKDHPQKMGNPQPATFRRYMGSFNDAMASLKEAGAEVVNCTPGSAMNLFPKMTTREALDLWGIDAGRNPCPTAAAISRRPDGECARGPGL